MSDNNSYHQLIERVKELNCLYGLSELINTPGLSRDDFLQAAVELIPLAWQYPEFTCARLRLGEENYLSKEFRETQWNQSADIIVDRKSEGSLEVFYLKEMPQMDEGPFLKEERKLINTFTERLGKYLERIQYEKAIRESEKKWRNQEKTYRYIFENNPHPMWIYDEKTLRFLEVNDTAVENYGYTKDEFYKMTLLDIRPGEEQERLKEHVRLSSGKIQISGYWKHFFKKR